MFNENIGVDRLSMPFRRLGSYEELKCLDEHLKEKEANKVLGFFFTNPNSTNSMYRDVIDFARAYAKELKK